jgi:alkylated DNA repair dioxygenase AlkB
MHQGGVYYKEDRIHGMLLLNSEYGGDLSHFSDRVIISRIARRKKNKKSKMDVLFKAALGTMENNQMVGLAISNKFQDLPVTFGHGEEYGISGFWHLTHIFAVGSEEDTVLMGRLFYGGPESSIWWKAPVAKVVMAGELSPNADSMKVLPPNETSDHKISSHTCSACGKISLAIFEEGWTCTNPNCAAVGNDQNGQRLDGYTYSSGFLEPFVSVDQLAVVSPRLLPDLRTPMQLGSDADDEADSAMMRDDWRGYHCSGCNTLHRRREYARLGCECGISLSCPPAHVPLDRVADEEFLHLKNGQQPEGLVRKACVQIINELFDDMFASYTFKFSDEAFATIFYARQKMNEGPDGNDAIYAKLQAMARSGEMPMQRAKFDNSKVVASVTRHFLAPFGRQYNAKMDLPSVPFDQADPLISDLVQRAGALVKERLNLDIKFNQSLVVAYLSEMVMDWHDDGEHGLEDVIVSHSFGATCTMQFAMKAKYYSGRRKSKQPDEVPLTACDPHLPGCLKYEQQVGLLQRFKDGELSDDEYRAELTEIVRANKVSSKVSPPLLTLRVPHGAYVVMHGKNMQKYYEHKVESDGLLRFVATIRHITDDHDPNAALANAANDVNEDGGNVQMEPAVKKMGRNITKTAILNQDDAPSKTTRSRHAKTAKAATSATTSEPRAKRKRNDSDDEEYAPPRNKRAGGTRAPSIRAATKRRRKED